MPSLAAQIDAHRDQLTPAERRVAEVVLADADRVAFGTVAALAIEAGTSGATVVRFANRIGFDGYVGLQAALRDSIGQRLRPAAERIRDHARGNDLAQHAMAVEVANVSATLEALDERSLAKAVDLLADEARRVTVLAGDAEHGIGTMLVTSLATLRPGVDQASGADVAVARAIATLERGDVAVAIDLRRYERWVLVHAQHAVERGIRLIAITDSALSPLAGIATVTFTVAAEGVGPFDSHVGTLALANTLVAGVARARRRAASTRLDRIEASWRATDALVE